MSNLADLINQLDKGSGTAVDLAGNVLGTLADIGGAVGTIELLLGPFLSQDNQLTDVLNAINADFEQIAALLGAEDKLERMRDVDSGINPAIGVFQQLPAMVQDLPSLSQEFVLQQIQTCVDAVDFFAGFDDKWQAVAGAVPHYSDDWSGEIVPPASDGLVFNYTYTLPQYLRAIYILLAVIEALSPASRPEYSAILSKCSARLQWVHDTIVSTGIIGTRVPQADDNVEGYVMAPSDRPSYWATSWAQEVLPLPPQGLWPYGAIEQYSAVNNVASYFPYIGYEIVMEDYLDSDPARGNFLALLQLRIALHKKLLYEQIGLPVVRNAINLLNSIIGQPPLAGPPYEDFPVSEGFTLLGIPLPSPGPARIRALETFFAATPPYCGGSRFNPEYPFELNQGIPVPGPPVPGPSRIVPFALEGRVEAGWPTVGLPEVLGLVLT